MELYKWVQPEVDDHAVSDLQVSHDLCRPLALALASRGLTAETAADFLRPSLQSLSDPYSLKGTEIAAERLWRAARDRERVLIHGDYDTDGITAAVLLSAVLSENGISSDIFLPHRIDDGYGMTVDSIDKANCSDYSLLVTVDCGINSVEAVAAARERGLEVIVTDHHEPGDLLPDACAVIDPKLPATPEEIIDLAGVGVAFKLCHAFLKFGREHGLGGHETDLREHLDLVALGTVADIVPLLHENRILVRHGLPILSQQKKPGIRALCESARLNRENLSAVDIAFRLAPRINAPGRMGDPALSMALLTATSMVDAGPLADAIEQTNLRRRELENQVVALAEAQLRSPRLPRLEASIVVCGEDWHAGVLGIVAARLSRIHHLPTVVLGRETNGALAGSVRGVPGVNVVEALHAIGHLLERYGGHAMAAGVSLQQDRLADFAQAFDLAVKRLRTAQAQAPQLPIDGEIGISELNDRFFEQRRWLEPFGHGHAEPRFLCRNLSPGWVARAGREHSRGVLENCDGQSLGFVAFQRLPESFPEPPWDLVVKPQLNTYNEKTRPQLEIVDLRASIAPRQRPS